MTFLLFSLGLICYISNLYLATIEVAFIYETELRFDAIKRVILVTTVITFLLVLISIELAIQIIN